MRYSDYDTKVFTTSDLEKYIKIFEKDIINRQKQLLDYKDRANNRIRWIEECEVSKNYCILGGTMKNGRNKSILLIIRYPDGTQRDIRYSFNKVSEMRKKLQELKTVYSGVDWTKFTEEI